MTVATLTDAVTIVETPAALDAIARPETALAIWCRSLPDRLRAGLDALDLDSVDDVAMDLAADRPVGAALIEAGYAEPIAGLLARDIELLVRRHTALTGEDRLGVKLEVIETDACRRFHADFVTMRLLCSYVGPGTQWCHTDATDAVCDVPTGAVALFKGRLLLDPPTVLHRSPPIVARGERRLMLTIDPLPARRQARPHRS